MSSIVRLTEHLTQISETKVLDKRTGNILNLNNPQVQSELNDFLKNKNGTVLSVNTQTELVHSVSTQKFDLILRTSDGVSDVKNGFLIEVFESGSNGVLTRLYKENLEDPVDDNKTISDGFSNYFTLEIDV